MAILIKGMKMPDSCGECPLHDGEYGWCNANTDIVMSFDERPRSCPLVELLGREETGMNSQQAINLLNGLEQSLDDYCGLNDEGKAAFRMAITALELFGISEQLPSAQPEKRTDKRTETHVCDSVSRQIEPLTDKEQRIFLAAMGREEKECKQVDDECRDCREPYENSLVGTCHEITRKVKGALWTI